jgi:hypothetical protein
MAAVIKPGASDTSPTWRKKARAAYQQAKKAGMSDAKMAKLLMDTIEDEMRKRDAMLEWYRAFRLEPCPNCGHKHEAERLAWDEL